MHDIVKQISDAVYRQTFLKEQLHFQLVLTGWHSEAAPCESYLKFEIKNKQVAKNGNTS